MSIMYGIYICYLLLAAVIYCSSFVLLTSEIHTYHSDNQLMVKMVKRKDLHVAKSSTHIYMKIVYVHMLCIKVA